MTFSPIVVFLLSISPWTGVWRVQMVDSVRAPTHMFIRPDLSIELYEPNWSSIYLEESRFDCNQMRLVGRADSGVQTVSLQVELEGAKSFGGMIEMSIGGGQFKASAQVEGLKVIPFAPPAPPQWIADSRAEDKERIDILGLVVRQAPRGSFEEFVEFWEQQVEWKYYIYLHAALYGAQSDPAVRLSRLRALFEDLQSTNPSRLASLEEQALSALPPRIRRAGESAACRVLLPALSHDHPSLEHIAVEKIPYPKGDRPCCSFKNFKAERFLFLPMPLAKPSEKP